MVLDYEVTRKIWEAVVPVEITLEDETLSQQRPYFALLPRTSYFPLFLPKAIHYFQSCSAQTHIPQETLWLEYGRSALKLYYPIGVLFDLYNMDSNLPWKITLKTKDPPAGVLNVSRDTLESMFMQSIKEADFLRRKAELITAMKPEEHKKLWNGVMHGKYDEYWSVNKRLVDDSAAQYNSVPIRLYQANSAFRQCPTPPINAATGNPTTLGEAVSKIDESLDQSMYQFLSQGISLPLDVPLVWLAQNLSFPDNFVHVVAVEK